MKILVIFLFFIVSFFTDLLSSTDIVVKDLKDNFNSRFGGFCSQTLTFSIERVDPGFNLSKEDAKKYAIQAADLWNNSTGRKLLEYKENGQIKISFFYDERQQETIKKKILEEKIKNQKSILKQESLTLKEQEIKFEELKNSYENNLKVFDLKLNVYNLKIQNINNSGGADSNQQAIIGFEKIELEKESLKLENQRNEINNYMQNLNLQVTNYNSEIKKVNQSVNVLNVGAGQEFEEGFFVSNTITLYQYENELDLKRLLAHELGHALGFDHVQNRNSIMYYLNYGNNFKLTKEDLDEFQKVCGPDKK